MKFTNNLSVIKTVGFIIGSLLLITASKTYSQNGGIHITTDPLAIQNDKLDIEVDAFVSKPFAINVGYKMDYVNNTYDIVSSINEVNSYQLGLKHFPFVRSNVGYGCYGKPKKNLLAGLFIGAITSYQHQNTIIQMPEQETAEVKQQHTFYSGVVGYQVGYKLFTVIVQSSLRYRTTRVTENHSNINLPAQDTQPGFSSLINIRVGIKF